MSKPKVAFYWCASCGGCEEAVVDLAEDILGVVEAVDIIFWPCAMDFKKADVEAMPDKSIVATLLNGAIRTSEQEEMAHLMRRKSQYLIAYGSCAATGGIPSLANQSTLEAILRFAYHDGPSMANEPGTRPQVSSTEAGHALHLPQLREGVRSLDQVVDVDYYIPGCWRASCRRRGPCWPPTSRSVTNARARRASPPTWDSPSSSGRTRS
jgi:F420-non-reducing hydrogenase small subunit